MREIFKDIYFEELPLMTTSVLEKCLELRKSKIQETFRIKTLAWFFKIWKACIYQRIKGIYQTYVFLDYLHKYTSVHCAKDNQIIRQLLPICMVVSQQNSE